MPLSIGLLAKPNTHSISPMKLSQRIHNSTHAPACKIIKISRDAGWADERLPKAINDTCTRYEVCLKSGPTVPSRKISLSHVNQDFNDEIQTDFIFIRIREKIYTVINFCDTGTAYSEGKVVKYRNRLRS